MSYTNRKPTKMLCAFKSYEDLIDFGCSSLSAPSFRAVNREGTQSFYGVVVNSEDYPVDMSVSDTSLNNLISKFKTVNPEIVETVWNQHHSWCACFDVLSSLVKSSGTSGVLIDRHELNITQDSIGTEWPTLASVVATEAETAAIAQSKGREKETNTRTSGGTSGSGYLGWTVSALASGIASAMCISSPSPSPIVAATIHCAGAEIVSPPSLQNNKCAVAAGSKECFANEKKRGAKKGKPASDADWELVSSCGGSESDKDRERCCESNGSSESDSGSEEQEEEDEQEYHESLPVFPINGAGGRSFRDALLATSRNDKHIIDVVDPSSREGRRQSKALRAALLATAPYRVPSVVVAPPDALQNAVQRSGGVLGLGGQMRVDRQYMFDYQEDPDYFVSQEDEDYFCSSEYSKGTVSVSRARDAVMLRPQVIERKIARMAHLAVLESRSTGGKVSGSIAASKTAAAVMQLRASVVKSKKNERSSAFKRRNMSSSPPDDSTDYDKNGIGAMLLTEGTRLGRYAGDESSDEDDVGDTYEGDVDRIEGTEQTKSISPKGGYSSFSSSSRAKEAQRRRLDSATKRKSRKTLRLAKLVANNEHCDDKRRSRAVMYLMQQQEQK